MTGVFAIMNGVVPAIAQDEACGVAGADVVSFATPMGSACSAPLPAFLPAIRIPRRAARGSPWYPFWVLCLGIFVAHNTSIATLVVISVVLGISYAGTANIMLNGLGIVLSPKDNTGYLPGMNAGAFNLGAGLSFAVLYAAMDAYAAQAGAAGGYAAAMVMGAILLALALATSFPYSEGRGRRQQLVSFAPAARSVAQPALLHKVAPFLTGITATRYSC